MSKQVIPFLSPNDFFKDFIRSEGNSMIRKATQTHDGIHPDSNYFSIMRVEEFAKHIKFPIRPGRSTAYHFCWLKKGQMVRTNALQNYLIGPDMIWFYKSGEIMSTESCSPDAEGYYCIFDKDFILQLLKTQSSLDDLPFFQSDGNPMIKLSPEESIETNSLLKRMEEEHLHQKAEKNAMIGVLLYQLLLSMKRLSSMLTDKKIHSAPEILTHQFLQSLKTHALTQNPVTFYADMLNITANHLNKCVKDCSGKPVTAHIAEMVILEAKVRLKQTPHNISEIAEQLGFENLSYFSRVFKKHTGMTPKDYRQQFVYPTIA